MYVHSTRGLVSLPIVTVRYVPDSLTLLTRFAHFSGSLRTLKTRTHQRSRRGAWSYVLEMCVPFAYSLPSYVC
jgi:hypothetical protein